MNNEIAIIIQARTGSTRLPNKLLLSFYNEKTILEVIIERLIKYIKLPIILATTTNKNDDALEIVANKLKIDCFRGSEKDVLSRFLSAADFYKTQRIIRVCADNPFINSLAMNEMINLLLSNKSDYISFKINGKPSIKTHFGLWGEYVTLNALKKVYDLTDEPYYHEHVTNYIYENPNLFLITWVKNNAKSLESREDIRLTIDTLFDFNIVAELYNKIYSSIENPTIDEIVHKLDEYPKLLEQMKQQIIQNTK